MRCACGTIVNMTLPFVTREMRHAEDLCRPLASLELPGSSLNPGRKDDSGKTRYDLLPWRGLILVAMVMTHGAKKYAPDNWRKVEGWRWRYFRAAIGHLIAWWGGEKLDPEWCLPHLAHAACCVLFLLELDHCTDVHVDTKSTDQ
jgi:hypothetical protein